MGNEMQILQNVFDFFSICVCDCMILCMEIVVIDLEMFIEEVLQIFVEIYFFKLLVYCDLVDNIIGYIYLYEMFWKLVGIK